MNFLVIKIRWLMALGAALLCIMFCISIDKIVPAFSVNGREIPIYSVERDDKKIALTFDCAWNNDDIEDILNVLDRYNVKATFFILGDWANKYPESVEEIYARGHQIGTHSMSHTDYTTLTYDEILKDISENENIIWDLTDNRPILFRAPSGAYNNTVVKACEETGRIYVQWSIDSLDYIEGATVESIYERVVSNISAGDIILMHNGTQHTVSALPVILEELSKEYEFSKLLDMVYFEDYIIDHTGRQISTKKD